MVLVRRQASTPRSRAPNWSHELDDLPLGKHPRHRRDAVRARLSTLAVSNTSSPCRKRRRFTINRHIVPERLERPSWPRCARWRTSCTPRQFEFAIDPPYTRRGKYRPRIPSSRQFARAYSDETGRDPDYGYSLGVADANYFAADLGIPTVHFGPHGDNFHQANEWVDVPSIAATARIVLRWRSTCSIARICTMMPVTIRLHGSPIAQSVDRTGILSADAVLGERGASSQGDGEMQ